MANHEIPRTADLIETLFGVADDGNPVVCKIFQHTRAGHSRPMFYVLQYRELNRRIDRSSRVTREFTGPNAGQRLKTEIAAARLMLAQSVARAARRGPVR